MIELKAHTVVWRREKSLLRDSGSEFRSEGRRP